MSAPRVAIVCRRFWPFTGDTERLLAALAEELIVQGANVTVVTGRHCGDWPARFVYRRVPVERLNYRAAALFGGYRFERTLAKWLRRHRDSLDAVIVSPLGRDVGVALKALGKSGVPVLARAESGGAGGSTASFLKRAKRRLLDRLRAATNIIAPCESIADELRGAELDEQRIHVVANGVRTSAEEHIPKTVARLALAEAHPILAVDERAPLAIYAGPIDDDARLVPLIDAWAEFTRRYPGGRLWLSGNVRRAENVWEQISMLGMREQIILPGVFDDYDHILAAADLFVSTGDASPAPTALLEAMAAGLPIVAARSPTTEATLPDGAGVLLPPNDAAAWRGALFDVFDQPERAARLGESARRRAVEQFSISQTATAHLQIINRLLQGSGVQNS